MQKSLRLLGILTLVGLGACTSSTDPVDQQPASVRAGSELTFYREITSDTSWTMVENSDTLAYRVASIDTALYGATKAHFVSTDADTSIYRLDVNGNVLVYQPAVSIPLTELEFPESWSALPIATKQAQITEIELDTTVMTEQGFEADVFLYRGSGYIGSGSITIDGKTYATEEAFVESKVTFTVFAQDYTTTVRIEYGYSSELKTFVVRRMKTYSNHGQSPFPNGGETLRLVKFTL